MLANLIIPAKAGTRTIPLDTVIPAKAGIQVDLATDIAAHCLALANLCPVRLGPSDSPFRGNDG